MSVHDFPSRSGWFPPLVANGGGDGYDGNMEARVAKLEEIVIDSRERLAKIETRLDQTATKADLHEASGSQIKWMVGTAVGLGATAIVVMSFVLNNAVPKTVTSAPAPIIIQVPAYAPQGIAPVPSQKR